MSQSEMKSLDLKETESVDFDALGDYIVEHYGESKENFEDEIKQLNNLRENIKGVNKDISGRDLLLKYYGQLEYTELRFPLNENGVKVHFSWKDTISETIVRQYSIAYEKASVLFNIAALQTNIASTQDRFSESGLKSACNYFQRAAGTLSYLSENFMHAPTVDMSREVLTYLTCFLLAQAQECFWEKSVLDKKSRAIISRLAQHTSKYYANCIDILGGSSFASRLEKTWSGLSAMKKVHFASVAQYHMAIACHEKDAYGEEIARLSKALELADEAMSMTKKWAGSLPGTVEAIKMNHNLINTRKSSAEKDNDSIYHELVPDVESLDDIEELDMVKATPFSRDLREVSGKDIFSRLIPISVHEASSMYSEELAQIQRQITELISVKNEELESAMSSMGLPDDILSYGLTPSLPLNISSLCKIVRKDYNMSTLKEMFAELAGLSNRCSGTLNEVDIALKNCDQQGEAMHYNYGSLWEPSTAIRDLEGELLRIKQEVDHHRSTLSKASESDGGLSALLEKHAKNIELLGGSDSEIVSHIPTPSLMDTSVDEAAVARLRELCGKVELMKDQRRELEKKLKKQLAGDDITSQLVYYEKRKNQRDAFFASERAKHDPILEQINQNLEAQVQILDVITEENGKFRSSRLSERDIDSEKEMFLQSLKDSFEAASNICKNLKSGLGFYKQFVDVIDDFAADGYAVCSKIIKLRNDLSNELENQNVLHKEASHQASAQLSMSSVNSIPEPPPLPPMSPPAVVSAPPASAPPPALPVDSFSSMNLNGEYSCGPSVDDSVNQTGSLSHQEDSFPPLTDPLQVESKVLPNEQRNELQNSVDMEEPSSVASPGFENPELFHNANTGVGKVYGASEENGVLDCALPMQSSPRPQMLQPPIGQPDQQIMEAPQIPQPLPRVLEQNQPQTTQEECHISAHQSLQSCQMQQPLQPQHVQQLPLRQSELQVLEPQQYQNEQQPPHRQPELQVMGSQQPLQSLQVQQLPSRQPEQQMVEPQQPQHVQQPPMRQPNCK